MGLKRSFFLITTAAIAAPSIASAQEQTVFVTGGGMQDREQRVTVVDRDQDRTDHERVEQRPPHHARRQRKSKEAARKTLAHAAPR